MPDIPPSTLSEKTRVKLPVGIWLMLLLTVGAAFGTIAIAQHQISDHERRLARLEDENASARLMLERIDERTAEIKRQLDRLAK